MQPIQIPNKADLQEQKMTTKAMKAKLIEILKEHKRLRDNQAEPVRRQEELAREM